jgi:uncharacterized damage-inducible protein DinB
MDVPVLQELYRYNRWANDRVFEAVDALSPQDFTKDLCNSYPSVRDTLTHIVSGEWIWLQRWKGTSPRQMFDPEEFSELKPLKARWVELSADQSAFLGTVTPERLRAVLAYVNLKGQTWRYPLWRPDVSRGEPLVVSPRSAHDNAASAQGGTGPYRLSGLSR